MKKGKQFPGTGMKKSLKGRILGSTISAILLLVAVCCCIMILSMRSLTNSLLLDNLQPLARQGAKTVEANIHLLADRMMSLAGDTRLVAAGPLPDPTVPEAERPKEEAAALEQSRQAVLAEAKEIYELYTIALYDLEGNLLLGDAEAPQSLETDFFSLLKETDNLTTKDSTLFENKPGITMGMPVKENGATTFYVVGVYKYDMLNDVLSNINVGKNGHAFIVNEEGLIVGYTDQKVVLQNIRLTQLAQGYTSVYQRLITGETGAAEALVEGENLFLAYSPVRGTQWSLVIEVPKSDYADLTNQAVFVTLLFTLIVVLLAVALLYRLAGSISSSVKRVTGRMVGLAEGNLQESVEIAHSRDELELLTSTLSKTVTSINRYISEIQRVLSHIAAGNLNIDPEGDYKGDFALIRDSLDHIIGSMNETMNDFNGAALRLSHMAETLSNQSGVLHQASMEQNESANLLVSEIGRVKDSLGTVVKNTEQTKDKTQEIAQRIQEANTQMEQLSGAMDNINDNAREITKIAKAIEDIAFQTNLLALNASVEAARAGAAGKGFSVVAGEVKDLAAKSAEAAKNATAMVANTHKIIDAGVALTADTAGSLQVISAVSAQIGDITRHLSDAVEEQEAALTQMDGVIGTISSIADQNLQSAGATQASSSLLAQEADELHAKVQKFVLKEDSRK